MSFIAGAGTTNIDLLYTGMPRIPDVGEELYSELKKELVRQQADKRAEYPRR